MDEWKEFPLGALTENLDSKRVPVKETDRKVGPYPYYGASGVVDHIDQYLFEGLHLLIAEDGENLRTRKLPIAFLAEGRFWVNNHAHVVRGNHRADTRFLSYALKIADVTSYLTGSTMPKLTQGNLLRIPIRTPSLPKQRAIAETLGALDEKIELNRRTNAILEAAARTLFNDWFIDFGPTRAKIEGISPYLAADIWRQFPDSFDSAGRPDGWAVTTIGEEVSVFGGSTPSTREARFWGGDIAWATPKDLSDLNTPVLLSTERKITAAGLSQISSGLLPVHTVLMSSRAPIGYIAIAQVPVAVNQGFIAMVCRGRLSSTYIWLWTRANMELILQNANGSTFLEISKSNFRPLPVVVPPASVLGAFDSMAKPLWDRIVANELEIRSLQETRDFLLPRLMSGEIRLDDAVSTT